MYGVVETAGHTTFEITRGLAIANRCAYRSLEVNNNTKITSFVCIRVFRTTHFPKIQGRTLKTNFSANQNVMQDIDIKKKLNQKHEKSSQTTILLF